MPNYSYRYPLLNDADWLRAKYIDEGLSTIDITRLAGAKTANSARQALMRCGIPVRDFRQGQVHKRQHDFIFNESVLTGCLLGDGYMRKHRKESSICAPAFWKRNKYLDHVQYVAGFLFSEPERFITSEISRCRGKEFPIHLLRGHTDECLTPLYEKWYPESNGYKKVVPLDIELDEVSLLHWYMDDGSSYRRRIESATKQIVITFASESFTKEENEFLARQMKDKWNFEVNVRKYHQGSGWRLHLKQSQTEKFFEVIGAPPVKSLAYKWK